jgi:hypothetical protein
MTSQGGDAVSADYGGGAPASDDGYGGESGRRPHNDFGGGSVAWEDLGASFDDAALDAAIEAADPGDRYADPADDPFGDGDVAEVEHAGRRWRLPRALAEAVTGHAEQAQREEGLAYGYRALEAERSAFVREAEARRGFEARFAQELGRLSAVEQQLAGFDGLDWRELAAYDPAKAAELQDAYQRLHAERQDLAGRISFVQQREIAEAQHAHDQAVQHCHATLARAMPDWSPELADQLAAFGQEAFGFSPDEIGAVIDPRMILTLRLAMVGQAALEEQRAQASAARRIAGGQRTAPARTLRGRSGRFPASADTDDFAAFESLADERMRKRR